MAQLRQDHSQFTGLEVAILVVGPEDAQAFRRYWAEHGLPFTGLPDPTHSVLKLYGQEVNLFKLGRQPAQVGIDRAGRVRFVHYGHDPADIPDNQEILGLFRSIEAAAAEPGPA
jgi:peroxiredoxin